MKEKQTLISCFNLIIVDISSVVLKGKLSLSLLFVFLSIGGFGQDLFVLDSQTKQPIAYASITNAAGFGTYSDEDGLVAYPFKNTDTLLITHVAYLSKKLTYQDWLQLPNQQVFLAPRAIDLAAVEVKPLSAKRRELGYYRHPTFF